MVASGQWASTRLPSLPRGGPCPGPPAPKWCVNFLRWAEVVDPLLSLAGAVLTFLPMRAVRPAVNRWLDLAYGVGVRLYALRPTRGR